MECEGLIFIILLCLLAGVAGYLWGRCDGQLSELKTAQKKLLDARQTDVFDFPFMNGGLPGPARPISFLDGATWGDNNHFGYPVEIKIPKEVWMKEVANIPLEGLEAMLASATEQELYDICAFIKSEIDRRKTLPI